jgi:hypothetical protein
MKTTVKALIAGALAFAACGTALAERPHNLYRGGAWETDIFRENSNGVPMCVMHVSGGERDMYVKYDYGGEGRLFLQLFKRSWRFPQGGVEVPLTVGFDKNEMIDVPSALGRSETKNGFTSNFLSFYVRGDLAAGFLHEFGEANQMWVKFKAGDETPWVADMKGSRGAMQAFASCISAVDNYKPPTQPYNNQPQATQPFDSKPSQPAAPDRTPMQPKSVKTNPVKRDDGSI